MTIHCKCGAEFTDYYPGRVVALTDPTANLRECAKCGAECCRECARSCEGCCEVICQACTVVVDGAPCCAACAADAFEGVAA